MNTTDYLNCLKNGYESALSCLAMEFRDERDNQGRRNKIVTTYLGVLDLLLDTGWSCGLDPDSELPGEYLPQRYHEAIKGQ